MINYPFDIIIFHMGTIEINLLFATIIMFENIIQIREE